VTYTIKRLPLTLLKENESDEAATEELISQFFFTKSTNWETEREWRMILPLKDANRVNKELYLFNIPPNAITEIVFGYKMQQVDKEEILRIIKKDKASLM